MKETKSARTKDSQDRTQIAIIGMGCMFPESSNLKEYWNLLFSGRDAIKQIPDHTHWQLKDYFNNDPATPDHTYCTRGGFLPPRGFDPLSYGIPPNNIEATDTSQLLGLEVAKMALADAGYPVSHPFLEEKKVNVVLGVTGTQELVIPLGARLGHPIWKNALETSGIATEKKEEIIKKIQSGYVNWQENSFPGLLGNVVAGRIANRLNLSGTNAVSDAACASSLAAIHTAVMELASHRCDMSITGGVDTLNDIFMHMCFSKTGVLSHTSDAKPFSEDADGTVLGEGIGMLVLKRLEDAERDKDRIYAVIKGIGTSSDGRTSAIYAPEAKGQLRALNDAYDRAGIDPSTVELIEAHGTGTRVGDKVEFTALKQCFDSKGKLNKTALGSVKSMIGHTKAAAGAAGIIKTALALYHKVIPPTLKAKNPDPELEINSSPFYLNSQSKPWASRTDSLHPRRSGISAFGFGGSNFHAVLEEYDQAKTQVSWDGSVQILAFSAKAKKDIIHKIEQFQSELNSLKTNDPGDKNQALAWQAHKLRKSFSSKDDFRLLILMKKEENLAEITDRAIKIIKGEAKDEPPFFYGEGQVKGKLGFIFPGQGSQYTGMAKDLAGVFPEAIEAIEEAQACFQAQNGSHGPLCNYIYPLPDHVLSKSDAEDKLRRTDIAQVAIGAVSLAMTQILKRFKIFPEMTCGHSFGELSALYAAGWLDKKTFLQLAAVRGKFMAHAGKGNPNAEGGFDPGSMLAVQAPLEKIQALIADEDLDLVLANKNSPRQGVLSGRTKEVDRAVKICRQKKMRAVKLPVAAAFHSELVQEAATPFNSFVADIFLTPSKTQVMSNTLGTAYPKDAKACKKILGNQLMHSVDFVTNIKTMQEKGVSFFVEVGPKSVLTGLTKTILKETGSVMAPLDGSAGKNTGIYDLGKALCQIASQGFSLDLSQWEDPEDKPVDKKLEIMLTGANPKPARPETNSLNTLADPKKSPEKTPLEKDKANNNTEQSSTPLTESATQNYQTVSHLDGLETKGNKMNPQPRQENCAPRSRESIQLLQKGLEAMQQLQAQTARAHEKFLETQTQASLTLAGMMEQTRVISSSKQGEMAEQTLPYSYPQDSSRKAAEPVKPPAPVPAAPATPIEAVFTPEIAPVAETISNDTSTQVSKAPVCSSSQRVKGILYETVSRLTGFPVEMLEPDMDIESDLGIDSIKKVEIISELEKQIPDGKGLSTDHMSTVRTLEDICTAIQTDDCPSSNLADTSPSSQISEPSASGESGKIKRVLVEAISELTGFPVEMLEPEMNLESDLGIDSIKRVEILSRLEQELKDIKAISPDEMGTLKTIQDIVLYLTPDIDSGKPSTQTENQNTEQSRASSPDKKKTPLSADLNREKPPETDPAGINPILRQEIVLEEYPTNQVRFYNGSKITLSPGKKVYLTSDKAGIASAFQAAFEAQGISAQCIDINLEQIPELPDAGGIVIVPDAFDSPDDISARSFIKSAFCLARKNAVHLNAAGSKQGAFLTTVSFQGGGFGFSSPCFTQSPVYGGLGGLAKTAALEWKDVLCRALDLPASIDHCIENAEAAAALMMTHGAVEMGLDGESCNIPVLKDREIADAVPGLNQEDVVVITGGAKGVTAECAVQLALACQPQIILMGRSPEPFPEPDWIKNISDPGEMKKLILTHEFQGKMPNQAKPKPSDIAKRYQAIVSNRSILENLKRIKKAGSSVSYLSADIRDKEQIGKVFARTQKEAGPVTAVIHGAGVLEDKLIGEKTPEQFERVFDTKVLGMDALLSSVPDNLKYLVFFSSVAARSGNTGQCDYAMANEVLNKTAVKFSKDFPETSVVSINWGPWAGGMVNDSLKREFTKKGIDLIPLEAGAKQMLREMANKKTSCVEVVIGAQLTPPIPERAPKLSPSLTRTFGPRTSPVINDHKIDREPVVPFALLTELLAHTAEKNNPGLVFAGMDDMRLLKGVRPGNQEVSILVNHGKCIPCDGGFKTRTSLTADDLSEGSFKYATATCLLKNSLPAPPVLSKAAFMDLKPFGISVDEAYETILFHGPALQSIQSINGVSEKGIEITSVFAPQPSDWLEDPHAVKWTIDPMMLDAAFQAAILWAHETRKTVCLPSFIANLRIYSAYFEKTDMVRILFTVNNETSHKIQGYFTFLNDKNQVMASIMGFEAIADKTLLEKFHPAPLFSREKILAFAQGNPSEAFGEKYKVFDSERQIARLPRPPYFFMDQVVNADHPQWKMESGGWVEVLYRIPQDAWYFAANQTKAMPFCILLEIALQPCGWLAAYAGSALHSQDRLHFRNLGGKAIVNHPITCEAGTLTIRSRMIDVSKAGGMIIQDFEMEVYNKQGILYKGTTNFGFFTAQALSNQVGIRESRFNQSDIVPSQNTGHVFTPEAPLTPADKTFGKATGMPSKALRMIDEIEGIDFKGGVHGKGYIKGLKEVNAEEWFFDAHFYQDPVCPGSLGVESFLQMLRFFLIKKYDIPPAGFDVQMIPGINHEWTYRGQIIPSNKKIEIQAHVRETKDSGKGYSIIADGALVVDNICIYEMKNFGLEFITAHGDDRKTGRSLANQKTPV